MRTNQKIVQKTKIQHQPEKLTTLELAARWNGVFTYHQLVNYRREWDHKKFGPKPRQLVGRGKWFYLLSDVIDFERRHLRGIFIPPEKA